MRPRHYALAIGCVAAFCAWAALAFYLPLVGYGLLLLVLITAVVREIAGAFADREAWKERSDAR